MAHLLDFDLSEANRIVRVRDDPGLATTIGLRPDGDLGKQWRWIVAYLGASLGLSMDERTLRSIDCPPGETPDLGRNDDEDDVPPDHRYFALIGVLRTVRPRCASIVVEHRYVDYDWQSEHAAAWSTRHEQRSALVPRVHFFEDDLVEVEIDAIPEDARYLGYMILRPVRTGVVGRTLIKPPPELNARRLCTIEETPSVFGTPLPIKGVPFVQQDGEYLRCAHTAIWQVQHTAHARDLAIQRTTAHIVKLAGDATSYRATPSEGLTSEQVQKALTAINLPALFYGVNRLPNLPAPLAPDLEEDEEQPTDVESKPKPYGWAWEKDEGGRPPAVLLREQLTRLCCRYTSSGFPVVVGSVLPSGDHHAFTVVGWRDAQPPNASDASTTDSRRTAELIVCDDQRGPYEIMRNPLHDIRGAWVTIMVPLPEEVKVTGEGAELRVFENVFASAFEVNSEEDKRTGFEKDLANYAPGLEFIGQLDSDYSVRTTLIRGRELKAVVRRQQRSAEAVRLYRRAHLPNWVWVVEVHHRPSRDASGKPQPSVVAELVLDSTAHDRGTRLLLACSERHAFDGAASEREEADEVIKLSQAGRWLALPTPADVVPESEAVDEVEKAAVG